MCYAYYKDDGQLISRIKLMASQSTSKKLQRKSPAMKHLSKQYAMPTLCFVLSDHKPTDCSANEEDEDRGIEWDEGNGIIKDFPMILGYY
jgi:hypothetical protein